MLKNTAYLPSKSQHGHVHARHFGTQRDNATVLGAASRDGGVIVLQDEPNGYLRAQSHTMLACSEQLFSGHTYVL